MELGCKHYQRDTGSKGNLMELGRKHYQRDSGSKRSQMEIEREYYQHDGDCPAENFTEPNDRGLKTCLDCAGIFDTDGKGVAITDKRFDENYDEWLLAQTPRKVRE